MGREKSVSKLCAWELLFKINFIHKNFCAGFSKEYNTQLFGDFQPVLWHLLPYASCLQNAE